MKKINIKKTAYRLHHIIKIHVYMINMGNSHKWTHILSGFPTEPELTTTVDPILDPDVVKEIKEYYKVGNKVFIASSSLF